MIALGNNTIRHSRSLGPLMGRTYLEPRGGIMAKLSKLWEGLHNGPSGTYIKPHEGGYTFGRWAHYPWGWRFTHLGERSTMEACREALASADKEAERRVRHLNKRGKRRG